MDEMLGVSGRVDPDARRMPVVGRVMWAIEAIEVCRDDE
jgi:hypothetical protein